MGFSRFLGAASPHALPSSHLSGCQELFSRPRGLRFDEGPGFTLQPLALAQPDLHLSQQTIGILWENNGKHGEKAGWLRVRKVRNMEIGNRDLGSDAKSGTITTERRNNQQWMLGISFHRGETTRMLLKPPRHPVVIAIFVLPMPCGRSDQPGWDPNRA